MFRANPSRNPWTALAAMIGLVACLVIVTACTEQASEVVLEPTGPIDLSSSDRDSYEANLKANRFVFGSIIQDSVDVVVTVVDPDGEQVGRFDVSARGPEQVQFETAMAGAHQIFVSPYEEAEGKYFVGAFRQERVADSVEEEVDQLMSLYSDESAGGVVAVVKDGDIVFGRGYGLANVEYKEPNNLSTPYHMASISKQFTAMAVVILSQQGLLSLDDDVREYLPDLPEFGQTITLRHLLNHTSGLRDQWVLWALSGGLLDDVIRQQDLMRLIRRQRDLNFVPGAEYSYSNTGYMLLSEVVATVSGKPFGEWMSENIFQPLQMHSTQVYDDYERIVPGRAYSYHSNGRGLSKSVLSYSNSGATSLFTTAEDLAKWLTNFETGSVGGIQAIETLQTQGVLNNGTTIDYALGITVSEQNGLRMLSHAGSDAGFRTWLAYYPEIKAGVIVLGNDANFGSSRIGPAVADIFFSASMHVENEEPNEPGSNVARPAAREAWQPDSDELAAYAGRYYSDELETFYNASVQGGELILSHIRHGDIQLTPLLRKGVFDSNTWFIGTVQFAGTADGVISAMRMTNGRVRNLVFERVD